MQHLRTFVLATMASVAAFAQNPISADSPYQIKYAANLPIGDSFVDISNSGAAMTGVNHGTAVAGNGTICVNAYVFDYGEEFLECCACPVTPNGLQSYSVKNDLIANQLFTKSTPTSVVIKLVATRYSAGCGFGSLTSLTPGALVPGMVAWGTTLHANTSAAAGTYALTETAFTPATPNTFELDRLNYWCGVTAGGSGGGLCANCRNGGLGAAGK
jgi:hypothetical protein